MKISAKNSFIKGLLAFLIVLFVIPLGHTLMVLTEHMIPGYKFESAGFIGILGVVLVFAGVYKNEKPLAATLLGFIGGILIWTGWVEFSFVWIAEKLNVQPLMENNQVTTKGEYLVMMSSTGLLAVLILLLVFTGTRCQLFKWIQKFLRLNELLNKESKRPLSVVTFFETIMIIWTFYIVLLLVYDENIAGSKHWLTYVVAFGSLFWSLYLSRNLFKIQQLDYAIRYAIPTVVIFWNFVEIMGRWDYLTEIWIDPFGHWLENTLILLIFAFFIIRAISLRNNLKVAR